MDSDFFKNLPSEVTADILSRLPLRSIPISKCVCKSWLDLIETDEFLNSYHSKSAPALAVMKRAGDSTRYEFFELGDEVDPESHGRRHDPLTSFNFHHGVGIEGYANGLLFLTKNEAKIDTLYVCNPITREFSQIRSFPQPIAYGFGASRITGQHKVVCIYPKAHCHVHTLGTGSWRCVEASPVWDDYHSFGAFVNGKIYWMVSEPNGNRWISCFDVETECFTTFPVPPPLLRSFCLSFRFCSLRNCLCYCDEEDVDEIGIWTMKEESWSKEFVIPSREFGLTIDLGRNTFVAGFQGIRVFENGDVLLLYNGLIFYYHSNKTNATKEIGGLFGDDGYRGITSMLLTPSFLSLKRLGMENVISF